MSFRCVFESFGHASPCKRNMAGIEKYEAARRDLLALWTAKQRLLLVALSRFPKSHPQFKSISRVCHNDATCQVRHLCDEAICEAADRDGDDMFGNRPVDDDVLLPDETQCFLV